MIRLSSSTRISIVPTEVLKDRFTASPRRRTSSCRHHGLLAPRHGLERQHGRDSGNWPDTSGVSTTGVAYQVNDENHLFVLTVPDGGFTIGVRDSFELVSQDAS